MESDSWDISETVRFQSSPRRRFFPSVRSIGDLPLVCEAAGGVGARGFRSGWGADSAGARGATAAGRRFPAAAFAGLGLAAAVSGSPSGPVGEVGCAEWALWVSYPREVTRTPLRLTTSAPARSGRTANTAKQEIRVSYDALKARWLPRENIKACYSRPRLNKIGRVVVRDVLQRIGNAGDDIGLPYGTDGSGGVCAHG